MCLGIGPIRVFGWLRVVISRWSSLSDFRLMAGTAGDSEFVLTVEIPRSDLHGTL
jgi:hypothetical protein